MKLPVFDFWFWVLLVWLYFMPYVYDTAHLTSCESTGKVAFLTSWLPLSQDKRVFECKAIPEGEHQ